MDKRKEIPVGAVGTFVDISADFQMVSLTVDNPSGMWLYIDTLNRYIPPQRLGWSSALPNGARTVRIRFVDAPTGGVASVVSGGPVVAMLFDYDAGSDVGDDYALAQNISDLATDITTLGTYLQSLIDAINGLQGGWGATANVVNTSVKTFLTNGSSNLIISAPGAGKRLVIDGGSLSINTYTTWSGGGIALLLQNTPTKYIATATLTMNGTPTVPLNIPRGAGALDENEALYGEAMGGASAADSVNAIVHYHIEDV